MSPSINVAEFPLCFCENVVGILLFPKRVVVDFIIVIFVISPYYNSSYTLRCEGLHFPISSLRCYCRYSIFHYTHYCCVPKIKFYFILFLYPRKNSFLYYTAIAFCFTHSCIYCDIRVILETNFLPYGSSFLFKFYIFKSPR